MLLITPPAIVLLTQTQPAKSTVTVKYELRFISPSDFVAFLDDPGLVTALQAEGRLSAKASRVLRPEGINKVLTRNADNTMTVEATPMAQESVKRILQLLDIEPKSVLLTMRLVQKGMPESRPIISTHSNFKGQVTVGDANDLQSVTVIPHFCRDGKTVRLVVQVNKEKPMVQNLKLGVETKFVFPGNQELFVTATQE